MAVSMRTTGMRTASPTETSLNLTVSPVRSERFAERAFPVVLGDARIYDPRERVAYVEYWEHRRAELDEAVKRVSGENLHGIREDIDLYGEIRALLPELTNVLKNMNTLTADAQRASGFKELFEAVMDKLSE
jgi:hypothetical protein